MDMPLTPLKRKPAIKRTQKKNGTKNRWLLECIRFKLEASGGIDSLQL
jgi:hypothetical protein